MIYSVEHGNAVCAMDELMMKITMICVLMMHVLQGYTY